MRPFQVIVGSIFVVFAVLGVILFATFDDIAGGSFGAVTVWGTFDEELMADVLTSLSDVDERMENVSYVRVEEETLEQTLINALATGAGPEVVMVSHELLLKHRDKFLPTPYNLVSERDVRDGFIDEAQLLLTPEGILGLPYAVDPLVLYWNRNHLAGAGVANPPRYWDQVLQLNQLLTIRDDRGTVRRATIPLGTDNNITHAKDILATLLIQAGSSIVTIADDGSVIASLSEQSELGTSIGNTALRFYTQFADPARPTYSWNRALPEARSAFTSAIASLYVGYAGELSAIRSANPNLNFDVTVLPQERSAPLVTFGKMYVLAVPRASANPNSGMVTATLLASLSGPVLADARGLPSALRSALAEIPQDPFLSVFRNSALIARGWYDINTDRTDDIFRQVIQSVISGQLGVADAISQGEALLERLIDEQ